MRILYHRGVMIAVIDYDTGNLGSVSKALAFLGAEVSVTQDPDSVRRAEKIVLPGVGAFPDAMRALKRRRLDEAVKDRLAEGVPYLGICLGLQLLFEWSEEGGRTEGLGLLRGAVRRFSDGDIKVPQIGWNQVAVRKKECPLFSGLPPLPYFYFVHSYYVAPDGDGCVLTETDYGGRFASSIWHRSAVAVQFHPEKSQQNGMIFLKNFLSVRKEELSR